MFSSSSIASGKLAMKSRILSIALLLPSPILLRVVVAVDGVADNTILGAGDFDLLDGDFITSSTVEKESFVIFDAT